MKGGGRVTWNGRFILEGGVLLLRTGSTQAYDGCLGPATGVPKKGVPWRPGTVYTPPFLLFVALSLVGWTEALSGVQLWEGKALALLLPFEESCPWPWRVASLTSTGSAGRSVWRLRWSTRVEPEQHRRCDHWGRGEAPDSSGLQGVPFGRVGYMSDT